jgi:hypothetical protein
LYSKGIVKNVKYAEKQVEYTSADENGVEYLRLSFRPERVTVNRTEIPVSGDLIPDSFLLKNLGKGDYALIVKHTKPCDVLISGF